MPNIEKYWPPLNTLPEGERIELVNLKFVRIRGGGGGKERPR